MICAYTKEFLNSLKKRDKSVLSKLFKKIEQIVRNPNIGKYMCANRSGQQEVYIADAFRLYYSFNEKEILLSSVSSLTKNINDFSFFFLFKFY